VINREGGMPALIFFILRIPGEDNHRLIGDLGEDRKNGFNLIFL
jgi:hypothetical protein